MSQRLFYDHYSRLRSLVKPSLAETVGRRSARCPCRTSHQRVLSHRAGFCRDTAPAAAGTGQHWKRQGAGSSPSARPSRQDRGQSLKISIRKNPVTIRVMFIGTQVDTVSCKGADSVCCPLSCVFSSVFIMREAEIPRSRAAQCAAALRPAPSRCPPCRCRGTRCGCSGGSCGSISPSVLPPRFSG